MVHFCSILSDRKRKDISRESYQQDRDPADCSATDVSSPCCLMRDVMGLCLLTSFRNPVFLSYSPNREVSNMGMVRTVRLHLPQNIYRIWLSMQVEHLAQLVQKRLVPMAPWAAGHKLTQRARTLHTHRISISGQHLLFNVFSISIWNSYIHYATLIIWAYVLFRIGQGW